MIVHVGMRLSEFAIGMCLKRIIWSVMECWFTDRHAVMHGKERWGLR